jgi:hypothetical protein
MKQIEKLKTLKSNWGSPLQIYASHLRLPSIRA